MKTTYKNHDIRIAAVREGECIARVYNPACNPLHEFVCTSEAESVALAQEYIDAQVADRRPGDFVKSVYGGYWCGIVVEARHIRSGPVSIPGYMVRKGNGKLDWIAQADTVLIALGDESEAHA